jgi:hypothetical protein
VKDKSFFWVMFFMIIVFGMTFLGCETGNELKQFTVTFDSDGGTPTPNPIKVEEGKSINDIPSPPPTKSENSFGGWFTEKNGVGTEFKGNTIVTADITVYAKWTTTVKKITINGILGITGNVQIALVDELAQNANCAAAGKAIIQNNSVVITLKEATNMATLADSGLNNINYTGSGSYYIFFWNNTDDTFQYQPLKTSNGKITINSTDINKEIEYNSLIDPE